MATDTQLNRQAQGLLAQGRHKEAAELCIDGLSQDPDDTGLLVILARCDEAAGDLDGALERLSKAIAVDKGHAAAHFHLGRLMAARGEFARAGECFDECLSLDPNHAAARTLRARLTAASGDRAGAIGELKSALRADSNHVPAMTTLAELYLAEGQIESAHEQASAAVRIRPDLASVQMALARVLIAQQHFDFARQCLENAIKAAPDDPSPQLMLAGLLRRQGRQEEALKLLASMPAAGGRVGERTLLEARCLRESRRPTEALSRYAMLVEAADVAADLLLESAECALEATDPARATELLGRAELAGHPGAILLQARALTLTGAFDQAAALSERLHDSNDPALARASRLLSSRIAVQSGDQAAAASSALEFLLPVLARPDAGPDVVWPAVELADRLGRHEEALGWLEQLLARGDLEPISHARTQLLLAQNLDSLGRHADAAEHLDAGAWRQPFLGFPAPAEADENARLNALALDKFQRQSDDDVRRLPVFLAGWPGTGREMILAALGASGQFGVMPPATWRERRERLGLPVGLERVINLDDSDVRIRSRRYLRESMTTGAGRGLGLLESGVVVADDLPLLARLFPGAAVVLPQAELADLEIHWRLNGFKDTAAMAAAWKREQRRLEQLAASLPLNRIEIARDRLLTRPEATLRILSEALGLAFQPAMLTASENVQRQLAYREPGHWQHYQWTV